MRSCKGASLGNRVDATSPIIVQSSAGRSPALARAPVNQCANEKGNLRTAPDKNIPDDDNYYKPAARGSIDWDRHSVPETGHIISVAIHPRTARKISANRTPPVRNHKCLHRRPE